MPSTSSSAPLPDPALVVLVGASGSGKSTWARTAYRPEEIVSSDDLRAVAGSGRHDLDASADAFDLLDRIVRARLGRGLTVVVDTLGLDAERRSEWLALAREHGLPAVAVVLDTAAEVARTRNAARDRPVPASVLADQLRRVGPAAATLLSEEGWDRVEIVDGAGGSEPPAPSAVPAPAPSSLLGGDGLSVVLQLSRFPWGEEPAGWLTGMAQAAADAGFAGLAVMDHLIQIPQVDRAWEPIPEPWVTLGLLAGIRSGLHLGTLVTPVTFRAPGITAKAAATLSALTGGRAFVGVGAGWFEREHAAYGLPFPPPGERLSAPEAGIETMRVVWAPGTKAYSSSRVSLPETTCYPRPVGDLPVIVGGSGDRSIRIAARLGDATNLWADDHLPDRIATYRAACERAERPAVVTVLDTLISGPDRSSAWELVERHRGRTAAATYAARHHAGPAAAHAARFRELAGLGVRAVFVAPVGLRGPEDVAALAPLAQPL